MPGVAGHFFATTSAKKRGLFAPLRRVRGTVRASRPAKRLHARREMFCRTFAEFLQALARTCLSDPRALTPSGNSKTDGNKL